METHVWISYVHHVCPLRVKLDERQGDLLKDFQYFLLLAWISIRPVTWVGGVTLFDYTVFPKLIPSSQTAVCSIDRTHISCMFLTVGGNGLRKNETFLFCLCSCCLATQMGWWFIQRIWVGKKGERESPPPAPSHHLHYLLAHISINSLIPSSHRTGHNPRY